MLPPNDTRYLTDRAINQPRLYSDFAFAWTISGLTVIRARNESEAAEKFQRLSRATMLNQTKISFMSALVEKAEP